MKTTLEILMSEIGLYLYPDFLLNGKLKEKIKNTNFNKKLVEKYNQKLIAIKQMLDISHNIEKYISVLYTESVELENHDILKYHIQSYIQNASNLENKLVHLLDHLKKDLLLVVENKDEIKNAVTYLRSEVKKTFEGITEHRKLHVHDGLEFNDDDILNATNSSLILQNKDILSEYGVNKVKENKEESFQKARNKWVEISRRNNKQMRGITEEVLKRNLSFIYHLLSIETLQDDLDLIAKMSS